MNQTASTALIAAAVAVAVGLGTYALTGRSDQVQAAPASVPAPIAADADAAADIVMEPAPAPPEDDAENVIGVYEPVGTPVYSEGGHPVEGDVMIHASFGGDAQLMFQHVRVTRNLTRQAVLNLLNDPNSAQFRDVGFTQFDNGAPVICGLVNARNAMGGYGEFMPFYGTADWASIYDGSDSWEIGFRRQCVDRPRVGNIANF